MMTRRVNFRLYPTSSQMALLFGARRLHAYLYNACVEHRKTSYKRFGKSISYLDQQAAIVPFKDCWQDYKKLNHGSLQATVKRVDFAFQRFFKGIGGYPKFQSIRKYSGWTYPDARQGFKVHSSGVNGTLELRDLDLQIQMRGKARTWGTPTTCTIVYRNNQWFASITVNCEPVRQTSTGAVGIDFGVLTAAALSDGTKIENPRLVAKAQAQVRKASKSKRRKRSPQLKKKIKGSKRWRKASKRVSKLQRKVANTRQDWVHKVATQIVSSNSLVATEKLNIKGMTAKAKIGKRKRQKTGLNRAILDVGMGMLRSAIKYKLAEAGGIFVEVPTQQVKPSQRCAKCWELTSKTLSDRLHVCSSLKCKHTEDRDINSAQVCLIWASGKLRAGVPPVEQTFQDRGREPASSNVDGRSRHLRAAVRQQPDWRSSSTSCSSMKQLAQLKRQKRLTACCLGKLPTQRSGGE